MFAALPDVNLSFNEMTAHLRAHPFDDYMHEFVLQGFKEFRTRKLEKLIKEVMKDKGKSDPVLTAVMYEACICHQRQAQLLPLFEGIDPEDFLDYTPAIHIRSRALADQPLHRKWTAVFGRNIFTLAPLPAPEDAPKPPFAPEELSAPEPFTAADGLAALKDQLPPPKPRVPLAETSARALDALGKADAFLGPAMEHKASLSPVSRLRNWMVKVRTVNGSLSNSLEGIQTCYGRGLSRERADASYSMEMAERFSSYASFGPKGVLGYAREYPLIFAAYDELDRPAVNPADIRLEVPYAGQKLHWIEGHGPDNEPILVPAQFIFLFCNLDEQSLFSALGSTGLGQHPGRSQGGRPDRGHRARLGRDHAPPSRPLLQGGDRRPGDRQAAGELPRGRHRRLVHGHDHRAGRAVLQVRCPGTSRRREQGRRLLALRPLRAGLGHDRNRLSLPRPQERSGPRRAGRAQAGGPARPAAPRAT
jgi:hypothetical protein